MIIYEVTEAERVPVATATPGHSNWAEKGFVGVETCHSSLYRHHETQKGEQSERVLYKISQQLLDNI